MKHQLPSTPLIIATVISAILIGLLLWPFFAVIASAVILAYSFLPLHKKIATKVKRQSTAAMLTFLSACAIVIVPVIIVLGVTVSQAATLAQEVRTKSAEIQSSEEGFEGLLNSTLTTIENLSGGLVKINQEDIASYGASAGSELAGAVVGLIRGLASSVPAFFSGMILFIYLFLALLVYYRQLLAFFRSINPLDDTVFDMYITKARAMTDGMVKGQFLIALAQGALGAISFAVVGIPYIAFFFVILSFLSIIPLGGGIISIPLGFILLLTGNVWQGLVILLVHFIIVGNIDNILRPILLPEEARLPSALLLLGVFSGLFWFGFLGLFIGPIFLILGLTTLQVYSIANNPSKQKTVAAKKPNHAA